MRCAFCEEPVSREDEVILGDAVFHEECADAWLDENDLAPESWVDDPEDSFTQPG